MRRPGISNIIRIFAIIFIVMLFMQGAFTIVPMMTGVSPQRAAALAGSNNNTYYPPPEAPEAARDLWDKLEPVAAFLIIAFLGRIWFLLEKIGARLERNKLDVNLTVRRD